MIAAGPDAPQRPALTRERILRTALALVDREGLDGLSMRRLGAELGVEAMSLYNHVANKQAVVDGVVALACEEIVIGRDGPWDERLRHGLGSFRAVGLRHPHVFPLIPSSAITSTLGPIEAALECLRDIGLADDDAVAAYRTLVGYTFGVTLAEIAGWVDTERVPCDAPVDPALAAQFPNVVWLVQRSAGCDAGHVFEQGLDLILRGIGALADRRRC